MHVIVRETTHRKNESVYQGSMAVNVPKRAPVCVHVYVQYVYMTYSRCVNVCTCKVLLTLGG